MNYRHIFHAGNMCDVVKHASFVALIAALQTKETPITILDTHAGVGAYDLFDERAQKTAEAQRGVGTFFEAYQRGLLDNEPAFALLAPYIHAIKKINVANDLHNYPGSPTIAHSMLRLHDALIACELHPDDMIELRKIFRGARNVHLHHRDGYEALNALLPFKTPRGLILIDPPFEKRDEFETLVHAASIIRHKAAHAVVALWYPIKDKAAVWSFHEALIAAGCPKLLAADFIYEPEIRADRLNGSGLVILNPPWHFDQTLRQIFDLLHRVLQTNEKGIDIRFLAGG